MEGVSIEKYLPPKKGKCKPLGSLIVPHISVHFDTYRLVFCKTFLQNAEQHSTVITEKEGKRTAGTLHARLLGYMAARRVTRKHRLEESINQMLINVKLQRRKKEMVSSVCERNTREEEGG